MQERDAWVRAIKLIIAFQLRMFWKTKGYQEE
jgi:hypothetical protein